MNISRFTANQSQDVINLYTKVFADSEGQDEGNSIGLLVTDLINTTDERDIVGFVAHVDNTIVGCIFFSRITLSNDTLAFILSPVAISTNQQGRGIGQRLIRYGIEFLKAKKVEFVFTYGDPNYYSKVGFEQISEEVINAPFKLSQTQGWLAQPLQGGDIKTIKGASKCVAAFNKAEYW